MMPLHEARPDSRHIGNKVTHLVLMLDRVCMGHILDLQV